MKKEMKKLGLSSESKVERKKNRGKKNENIFRGKG